MPNKVLYLGCKAVDCPNLDRKHEKCTRPVIMLDDRGRCKFYNEKVHPKSWWCFW